MLISSFFLIDKRWSEQDTFTLLELLEQRKAMVGRPYLKKKLHNEILEAFKENNYDFTVEDIQRKIRNLLIQYRKINKRAGPKASGQGALSKWKFY